jgi:hypothetical protein
MDILKGWYEITGVIRETASGLVIFGGIAGICGIVVFSIAAVRRVSGVLAILVSALGSCILMIPVIVSFNHLVDSRVESRLAGEQRAAIRAQKAELTLLATERELREKEKELLDNQISLAKQSIRIEGLNDTVRHLESAMFNVQSFEKILELGLLEANLKQTALHRERAGDIQPGLGINADYFYDEYLIVSTHDITAKFGVDLNKVRLANSDLAPDTILVSGISSKFLGTGKNITRPEVAEMRRVDLKGRGEMAAINGIKVLNDTASMDAARQYAQRKDREYQIRLSQGFETGFMDDSVKKLAENFIKIVLLPLGKNVVFTAAEQEGALPLAAYIQAELQNSRAQRNELSAANESLSRIIQKQEAETGAPETAEEN